jgi:hypothetical protein
MKKFKKDYPYCTFVFGYRFAGTGTNTVAYHADFSMTVILKNGIESWHPVPRRFS